MIGCIVPVTTTLQLWARQSLFGHNSENGHRAPLQGQAWAPRRLRAGRGCSTGSRLFRGSVSTAWAAGQGQGRRGARVWAAPATARGVWPPLLEQTFGSTCCVLDPHLLRFLTLGTLWPRRCFRLGIFRQLLGTKSRALTDHIPWDSPSTP